MSENETYNQRLGRIAGEVYANEHNSGSADHMRRSYHPEQGPARDYADGWSEGYSEAHAWSGEQRDDVLGSGEYARGWRAGVAWHDTSCGDH